MTMDDDWFEIERLHRAAADADLPEVQRLVAAGHALDAFDEADRTPLHWAADAGHLAVVECLLGLGADANAHLAARIGETALCLAVQRNEPAIVSVLLAAGADPDLPGWMGLTARLRAQRRQDANGRRIALLIDGQRPAPRGPGQPRR